MSALPQRDPYQFPGGVPYTRLVRAHRQQGWAPDLHDEYLAAPGLSSSSLKLLASQTPAHFLHSLSHSKEPTPAMLWGTKVHSHVLEARPLAVPPRFDRRTKGGREAMDAWEQENARAIFDAGAMVVTSDEADALTALRQAVQAHPVAGRALECGIIETSGYATSDKFAVKIRPDCRVEEEGVIYDLKTCVSAAPSEFARTALNFGYHIQAAWYLAVAEMIEPGRYRTFRWIAVEKDAPYGVAVYEASPEHIALGSQVVERAVATLTRCLDEDRWPGFDQAVAPLELPRWAAKGLEVAQ